VTTLLQTRHLVVEGSWRNARDMQCESTPPRRLDVLTLLLEEPGLLGGIRPPSQAQAQSPPIVAILVNARLDDLRDAMHGGVRGILTTDDCGSDLVKALKVVAGGGIYMGSQAGALISDSLSQTRKAKAPRLCANHLSQRELQVLALLCQGMSAKQAASKLTVSRKTIENHRYNIYRKCNVDNLACLMRHAIANKLVELDLVTP
jgi:DNA-binding NarL/FixJ family response regulator